MAKNIEKSTPKLADDTLLAELAALRNTKGKNIAILGSRNLSLTHQQLIEMMAYGLASEKNKIYTSGGMGTNAAAIKGVKRAGKESLLVILPQTLEEQNPEIRALLKNGSAIVRENPDRRHLSLAEASRLCNHEIIDITQQVIFFLYHDSMTLLDAVRYARENHKIVTLFYLD